MKIIDVFLITLFFVFNIASSQDGNTPTNLTIDAASVGGVTLSWDTPENYRKEWISHSNFSWQGGIGAGSTPAFYCHKFPDSLLAPYHGMLIKDLAFVPANELGSDSASFQPLVFETDSTIIGQPLIPDITGRTNLVLSAPALSLSDNNTIAGAWNTIELKDHVSGYSLENDIQPSSYVIDSTKTLWFGYWMYDYIDFPAGADTGPANESLGNVLIWCPANNCYESTLTLSAQEGLDLNFDWLIALSLVEENRSDSQREILLSNSDFFQTSNINVGNEIVYEEKDINVKMGPNLTNTTLQPLINEGRDISNYFVFENGVVADVVQPDYSDFSSSTREGTILGPREPGTYSYFIRAQTADGLSDSSNVVSVDLANNTPGNFFLIAPEENASISVTPSNLDNPNTFIWSNSVDTDGQELYYLFKMCKVLDSEFCLDTTMTERIFQPTNQSIIDSFSLGNGDFDMFWSVRVTDGIDTLFAGGEDDSIRYFTFSTTQLGLNPFNIPTNYSLKQNYPNPFNPSTTIEYHIAKSEFVSISIFDLAGNRIKSILNLHVDSGLGYAKWDGKNELGQNVSGGIYLYRIDTPSFSSTRKMILLK
tara:strand:- start:118 stop:1899 length:1782 start_codon:yes stop_codon:yes gene_type:complete